MKTPSHAALWSLLLFIASLGLWFKADRAHALGPELENTFRVELAMIIDRSPRYAWGGSTDERLGLDCSGFIFLAARRAGLPVRRTTSARMAAGDGGWTGYRVTLQETSRLDLLFWTFTGSPNVRPLGHVGVMWSASTCHVAHASPSAGGVVVRPLTGALRRDLRIIRRLSHGE